MELLLIIILIIVLCGGGFGYHRGYVAGGPGFGIIGLFVLVLVVLLIIGRI